jgi:hypothetical protein
LRRTISFAFVCLLVYSLFGVLFSITADDAVANSRLLVIEYHLPGQTNLENGVTVNSTLSQTSDSELYTITVDSYAFSMRCVLICPDDADYDLYARFGIEPRRDTYDFRGYASGDEDVSYEAPSAGLWYFMVYSYQGKGSYNLTVSISYVEELQVGITSSGILSQAYIGDIWRITVGNNVTLMNIVLDCEPGDFDIYGKQGEHPTTYSYDWEASNLGNENFTFENPAKGTWFILVYPYEGVGSYNLTVNFEYGNPGLFVGPVADFFSSPFGISLTTALAVGIALFAYYRFRSPRGSDRVITGYEEHLASRYDSEYYSEPRFCMYCGTQFELGSDICQECGARKPRD